MVDQQFCLRWNNHQNTLISVFDSLQERGCMVDCTLAAEGQSLQAHKVVLSACSPYLEDLLVKHYDKHPILLLKDVKFEELKAMIDYMYRGEVNIAQDKLNTFLCAAKSLQIKGLTEAGADAPDTGIKRTAKGAPVSVRSQQVTVRTTNLSEDVASGDDSISPSLRKRRRRRGSEGSDLENSSSVADRQPLLGAASVSGPTSQDILPAVPVSGPEATALLSSLIDNETDNVTEGGIGHITLPNQDVIHDKDSSDLLIQPKTEFLEEASEMVDDDLRAGPSSARGSGSFMGDNDAFMDQDAGANTQGYSYYPYYLGEQAFVDENETDPDDDVDVLLDSQALDPLQGHDEDSMVEEVAEDEDDDATWAPGSSASPAAGATAAAAASPAKRSPGRPRRLNSCCVPGAACEKHSAAVANVIASLLPKRARGRPHGSRNKRPSFKTKAVHSKVAQAAKGAKGAKPPNVTEEEAERTKSKTAPMSNNKPKPLELVNGPTGRRFRCNVCRMVLDGDGAMLAHWTGQHKDREEVRAYELNEELAKQLLNLTPKQLKRFKVGGKGKKEQYACPICAKVVRSAARLKSHTLCHMEFPPISFYCEICPGLGFWEASQLYHHNRNYHRNLMTYQCRSCEKRFKLPGELKLHTIKEHGDNDDVFKCSVCNRQFSLEGTRDAHQRACLGH